MSLHLTRLFVALLLKPRPARTERGDVPGWVLITVMTAGLVVVIWRVAGEQLATMLKDALSSVSNK
ncbi:hypothetical protein EV645_3417 [Kribbella rubisoli]|jgi:hypothetical protein|uniref:DUF4244 domain-containing protein n=1 Tax=Kribbella rubisoli TaxID=3075929 RepID=A0A4Q7X000_9ACTN|nr:hypothetical protein [Kribbella rubisoli]RZU15878.1 hypothetical protein EV645_3417 [Kribbella rubisoli]